MPPPRLEAPEQATGTRRLAVYTDYAYTLHEGQPHAERAFAMFMAAVLEHADQSTIIGRLRPSGGQARYPLPAAAKFVALPYYPDGSRLLGVARALLRSATRLWHSLDGVDTVWVLGPQGLALPFALVVMLRRRRLRLGVRQDLPGYARARHPGRRTVHLLADGLELGYRLLARRYPIVVVGGHLRRSYAGGRAVLTASVSLVREADITCAADPARDWERGTDARAAGRLELLSVGRLETEKNPLLLAAILAGLIAHDRRWHLTVCGEGPLLPALVRRAEELGVGDHLDPRGYVAYPELKRQYRSSHVFVHTSLTEGLPQVLFEAFAAGVPVVATDVGGVASAVDGAALLITPDSAAAAVEAILLLQRTPELRAELVRAGRGIATSHTLEREATRVAEFLLGPNRRSPVRSHVELAASTGSGQ